MVIDEMMEKNDPKAGVSIDNFKKANDKTPNQYHNSTRGNIYKSDLQCKVAEKQSNEAKNLRASFDNVIAPTKGTRRIDLKILEKNKKIQSISTQQVLKESTLIESVQIDAIGESKSQNLPRDCKENLKSKAQIYPSKPCRSYIKDFGNSLPESERMHAIDVRMNELRERTNTMNEIWNNQLRKRVAVGNYQHNQSKETRTEWFVNIINSLDKKLKEIKVHMKRK